MKIRTEFKTLSALLIVFLYADSHAGDGMKGWRHRQQWSQSAHRLVQGQKNSVLNRKSKESGTLREDVRIVRTQSGRSGRLLRISDLYVDGVLSGTNLVIADRVLVRRQSGVSDSEFKSEIEASLSGVKILRSYPGKTVYVLGFDPLKINYESMMDQLESRTDLFEFIESDAVAVKR